ncbi:MAG: 5'/3'-nucleotidase SurE [Polyangiales bacterium]
MSVQPSNDDGRALIVCANDDGIFAKGLVALADALSSFARVFVVAPETEQSATSHSLTLHRPLRLRKVSPDRFALDGTPADCVYLALHLGDDDKGGKAMLPRRPDLVVSGINRGINLGQDVFYSGTVAAAREGALRGIPSIAFSCEVKADGQGSWSYDPAPIAELAVTLARAVIAAPRVAGPALLLNVNAPAGPIKGVKATRLGTRLWTEKVEARIDPRGRAYYWLGGRGVSHDQIPGSDTEAFDEGFATMTPLQLDLARHDDAAKTAVASILTALR